VGAAVVSVVYAGGVGTAIVVASRDTGITIGAGPWICAIGGLALLGSAAWLGISATRRDARTLAAAPPDDRS
jgi:hypothetical protein